MLPLDVTGIASKLAQLRLEHRELDIAIDRLQTGPGSDELTIKRLKKRKLQLKDLIVRLESAQIPDQPA